MLRRDLRSAACCSRSRCTVRNEWQPHPDIDWRGRVVDLALADRHHGSSGCSAATADTTCCPNWIDLIVVIVFSLAIFYCAERLRDGRPSKVQPGGRRPTSVSSRRTRTSTCRADASVSSAPPKLDAVAGRIRDEDIALVREKTPIADVIGEHVQLRNAGGGNLKGICPFHDEKSPSLSVSPATRAVPLLRLRGRRRRHPVRAEHRAPRLHRGGRAAGRAQRHPAALRRGRRRRRGASPGSGPRLVEAHAEAQRFYAEQLRTPEALHGARVPRRARLRPGGRRAVRLRVTPRPAGTR